MHGRVLAIDFGTSNTAAAVLDGAVPRRLQIETGADTLPTAVFFPTESGEMKIGAAAGEALIQGGEGRYMRALKSILGTSLFHEDRLIGGKRQTLADIVTAFLAALKQRAEDQAGVPFSRALSGRPVHFHSADATRDALAEADLKACYLAAGFDAVRFVFEPEAAALSCQALGRAGDLGLIVDIGGGTSDFSVFKVTDGKPVVLASHGIRLGGTDFDRAVSMRHVMPLLGHGGQLRRSFGAGLLPVPNAIYHELATWAKIPFLYTRQTERSIDDLLRHAVSPAAISHLKTVIQQRLGHELAFAAERGKIAANSGQHRAVIDMGFVAPGLAADVIPTSLNAALAGFGQNLQTAIGDTLTAAGVTHDQIDTAILVGGSSLMHLVSDMLRDACPNADLQTSDAFTAVVDGLALVSAEAWV